MYVLTAIAKTTPIVAPIVGAVAVLLAAEQLQPAAAVSSMWWPGVLSLILGIFVTLVGVVYRDQNRRLSAIEVVQEKNQEIFQTRLQQWHTDNKEELTKIRGRQDRMVGVMLTIAAGSSGNDKIVAQIQKLLECD